MLARRLAGIALVVVTALGWAPSIGHPPQPNVVLIMTDDQTVEQLAAMPKTRALIGDAGATFANAYISFPLCCPSRASFLTGQYAHNHGVLENDPPTGGHARLDHTRTLPVWLDEAGYHTIHIGKYLNAYGEDDPTEIPPGWNDWRASIDPSTYRMWGYTLNENGALTTYGDENTLDPEDYQTDVYARKAETAIREAAQSDEPFFLNLWFLAPHREIEGLSLQYPPRPAPRHAGTFADLDMPRPPSFNEPDVSDKPAYIQAKPPLSPTAILAIENRYRAERESLLAVDDAVETVVEALEDEGVLEDTYVLFVSDNGYFHGEHRNPDEKILAYEPSAKVPFLMRGPGIGPGTVVTEPVLNIDVAPTLVSLAGATPTLTMDGRSLLPYVLDPQRRTTRPLLLEAFFPIGSAGRFFTEQIPFGGGEGALPLNKSVLSYHAIHTDRYVYVEYDTMEHELYDLAVDPYQLESKHLDPAYLQIQLVLATELQRLRLCHGPACAEPMGPLPEPGA